jgi:transposase-like protein
MDTLSDLHFRDDTAAREYLEKLLWPEGPICPHCGVVNHAYATKRPGVFRCAEKDCRKDFTVTMRTVMERSKIALHKWLQAFHLMCSSKKGISAHRLHRTLDIGYEAAWFMCHRIREAMRDGGLAPLGGGGGIVEADGNVLRSARRASRLTAAPRSPLYPGRQTRPGRQARRCGFGRARRPCPPVSSRGSRWRDCGADRSREHRPRDTKVGADFSAHETVNHTAKEYVRGDVHTNSAEGYFSIFKRGMRGIYQHCGEKHLHRYLAEYNFRYNHRVRLGFNDGERAALAVKGATGKRLTYRGPDKTGL